MGDKKKELGDIEVDCGGTWKKVVPENTYDKNGRQHHKLEQGSYGTDDQGNLKEDRTISKHIDLEQ